MQQYLLKNKTVLITGASKGIGKGIATLFASEGARLVLLARNKQALDEIISSLNPSETQHLAFECDITSIDSIKEVAKLMAQDKVEIDVLVNNAGVMKDAMILFTKDADIADNINTNLIGTIQVTKVFLKSMVKNRRGSVINLTSIIGVNGNAGQSVYSAAKSGIIGFTKSLSKELAGLQIRVNAIAPGFIATDMTASLTPEIQESTIANIGMKRAGTAEDIANTALFLASDLSSYVTGQIIGVDGGMKI